jgi:hypothetical protein
MKAKGIVEIRNHWCRASSYEHFGMNWAALSP